VLLLAALPAAAQAPARIAVVGVDVLTMEDGAQLRRSQTVLIEGEQIREIGSNITVPADARRIDGRGLVMLPGLMDMHVHLEAHLELRERVKRMELLAPRVYTSGPYVNRPAIETEQDAARAAREQKAAGYDLLKIHGPLGNMAFRTLIDSAHALHLPVVPESGVRQRDRSRSGHGGACGGADLHAVQCAGFERAG
jgi:cytosine/adenosine deaminase-related metal-dependent hydrolase